MLISNILTENNGLNYSLIAERCDDFITESQGHPLLKSLPAKYDDFQKVKVRKRNSKNQAITETFNDAFHAKLSNLHERAVFANGEKSYVPVAEQDTFYVFPIDGYKYLYSNEIQNSTTDYKNVFDSIHKEFGCDRGNELITELLKFTYTSDKLFEGIEQGAEIVIYNIPYFYAVRAATIDNYKDFIQHIRA